MAADGDDQKLQDPPVGGIGHPAGSTDVVPFDEGRVDLARVVT